MNSKLQNLIVPLVLLLAAIVLPLAVPTYYVQLASKMLLMGMLAMALNLVVGFGGSSVSPVMCWRLPHQKVRPRPSGFRYPSRWPFAG
jgi:hypothetical protein